MNNCSVFVINGKKYYEKDQRTNEESGWFPTFYHFAKLRNDIAHNVDKKMENKLVKKLILATIEEMVEVAGRFELDTKIVAKIEKKRDEIFHNLLWIHKQEQTICDGGWRLLL